MKNIFKIYLPCLALSISMASCYGDHFSKDSVDSRSNKIEDPVLETPTSVSNYFENAALTGYVNSLDNVIEVGFQVSESSDFKNSLTYPCDEVAEVYETTVEGLEAESTYYYRSYAYTKTGKTIYSGINSFTTPAAPTFTLDGTYTCTDYVYQSSSANVDDSYEVTISFYEDSDVDVDIYNLWDGGETLEGTYDESTGIISVTSGQKIHDSKNYGPLAIYGVPDIDYNSYLPQVTLYYDSTRGTVTSSCYVTRITTGAYAGYDYSYPTISIMKKAQGE